MIVERLLKNANKITRAAFLYLESSFNDSNKKDFAQCKACALFFSKGSVCAAMNRRVSPEGSCGLFMEGFHVTRTISSYTQKELGYVETPVRCENCKWGGPGKTECRLFVKLNAQNPEIFALDAKISPKGCCNGFQKD
jgi:hypothetical protein